MPEAGATTSDPLLTELKDLADPRHTALLIVDMQNDFCADDGYIGRALGKDMSACQGVVGPIEKLLAAARTAGIAVIWPRAIYDPVHLLAPVLAKQKQMKIDAVCCAEGSWGAEFFALTPQKDEPVIDKHRYSAFTGTGLDETLRGSGIKTLVLAGVQTNVCIESTFREAFGAGYYLVIPRDCVASHTPELHQSSLLNFQFLFGTLSSASELAGLWRPA